MPFDFDPFSHLDLDHNTIVDAHDLQMYELAHGHGMNLIDLNHDQLFDQFQSDLTFDGQIDTYQADLNHNDIIDQFEFKYNGATEFNYDVNHDNQIDEMDKALATTMFSK